MPPRVASCLKATAASSGSGIPQKIIDVVRERERARERERERDKRWFGAYKRFKGVRTKARWLRKCLTLLDTTG